MVYILYKIPNSDIYFLIKFIDLIYCLIIIKFIPRKSDMSSAHGCIWQKRQISFRSSCAKDQSFFHKDSNDWAD